MGKEKTKDSGKKLEVFKAEGRRIGIINLEDIGNLSRLLVCL